MSRLWKTILLALVIVGGLWVLLNQDQIQQAGGLSAFIQKTLNANQPPAPNWISDNGDRWDSRYNNSGYNDGNYSNAFQNASSRNGGPQYNGGQNSDPRFTTTGFRSAVGIPPRVPGTIRVASFKMNAESSIQSDPSAMQVLTHLCSQFDIVAFQEINGRSDAWLAELGKNVAAATQGAVQFRALSDRSKIEMGQPQFAILFNTNALTLDQSQWYSVNDPDNLLAREPLVGWFRTRGIPTDEAFTFTLANIQLDNHRPDLELAYVGELFRAIRNDGRGEDDVIIVGNFNAGDRGLSPLRKKAGLNWVVFDMPTSTDKAHQFDNLVFSPTATVEFTGQGGVLDFLAAYNLKYDQAIAISEHMPIWAEFSATEGDGSKLRQPLDSPSLPNANAPNNGPPRERPFSSR